MGRFVQAYGMDRSNQPMIIHSTREMVDALHFTLTGWFPGFKSRGVRSCKEFTQYGKEHLNCDLQYKHRSIHTNFLTTMTDQ